MLLRLSFFIMLVFSVHSLTADEIVLVADEWCPYNCGPKNKNPGFMVEIAKYAFAKEGHKVIYRTVPWARAIEMVREGRHQGIIGTGRAETPDFIFPDIELGRATHTFYTRRDFPWKYNGLDSLKEIDLGVIDQYSHGNLYKDYIKPNEGSINIQVIGGEDGLTRNIKKLSYGRIDALVEDKTAFQYELFSTNTKNDFSDAGVAYSEDVFIAFSPKIKESKAYAKILDNGMQELRESGKLEQILNKYGVQDWKIGKETFQGHGSW